MNEKELKLRLQRDAATLGEFSEELLERIMKEVRSPANFQLEALPQRENRLFEKRGRRFIAHAALIAASICTGCVVWLFTSPSADFFHKTQLVRLPSGLPGISETRREKPSSGGIEEISSDTFSHPVGFVPRLVQAFPENIELVHELLPKDIFSDWAIVENESGYSSAPRIEKEEENLPMETFSSMWEDTFDVVHSSFARIFEE